MPSDEDLTHVKDLTALLDGDLASALELAKSVVLSDLPWTHESDLSAGSLWEIGRTLAAVDTPDSIVIAVWPWDRRAGSARLGALAEAIEWVWAPASEVLVVSTLRNGGPLFSITKRFFGSG